MQLDTKNVRSATSTSLMFIRQIAVALNAKMPGVVINITWIKIIKREKKND